jgi:DNA end-binding protein Ku
MASSLIDSMTEDFDAEQYHDSYREALEELVAAKVDGLAPPEPEERPAAEPVSLLDALQASLDAAGKDRPAGARKRPPRKRASA